MNDESLLSKFTRENDEKAFGEIVRRRHGMVYGTALRKTGSPQMADDIAQSVFLLLAQRASAIGSKVIVCGWLLKAAHFSACNALKIEARRRRYEAMSANEAFERNEARAMDEFQGESLLDDALLALSDQERDAVLLRYLQELSVDETAAALGISSQAAQRRASRGIERMRRRAAKMGVVLTTAAITAFLTENLSCAAPEAAVQSAIRSASLTSVSDTHITILTQGAYRQMTIIKLKIAACYVTGALAVLGTTVLAVSQTQQPSQATLAQEMKVLSKSVGIDLSEMNFTFGGNQLMWHIRSTFQGAIDFTDSQGKNIGAGSNDSGDSKNGKTVINVSGNTFIFYGSGLHRLLDKNGAFLANVNIHTLTPQEMLKRSGLPRQPQNIADAARMAEQKEDADEASGKRLGAGIENTSYGFRGFDGDLKLYWKIHGAGHAEFSSKGILSSSADTNKIPQTLAKILYPANLLPTDAQLKSPDLDIKYHGDSNHYSGYGSYPVKDQNGKIVATIRISSSAK
jgi:RNA polymerase sigma factor (sigma-70 family)